MKRDTLQSRACLAEQDRITKEIKSLEDQIYKLDYNKKELKIREKEIRMTQFYKHYNVSAKEIMDMYAKRFNECCYQGGRGYAVWLPYPYAPSYHHCVVKPEHYEKAQPSQQELDAFWAIYDEDMKITKTTHVETWGN